MLAVVRGVQGQRVQPGPFLTEQPGALPGRCVGLSVGAGAVARGLAQCLDQCSLGGARPLDIVLGAARLAQRRRADEALRPGHVPDQLPEAAHLWGGPVSVQRFRRFLRRRGDVARNPLPQAVQRGDGRSVTAVALRRLGAQRRGGQRQGQDDQCAALHASSVRWWW